MKLNEKRFLYFSKYDWSENSVQITILILLVLVILSVSCSSKQLPEPSVSRELEQVTENENIFGKFYTYIPKDVSQDTKIVVLVHGTPAKEQSAEEDAHYYVSNWRDFAEEHGFILIAPAFNQEDFSSREGDHASGGYRGLFGRKIMADEWLLRLVRTVRGTFGISDLKFFLYGHSAGGQFVGRFLVTHPDQVKQAVISSAATYPQPDPDIAWPFGMGKLDTDIEWDKDTTNHISIIPEKQKWLAATQIPLTVIVGLNDTSELPSYPGQKGKHRYAIGRNWVQDMGKFAEENGLESRIKIEIIPGKGHSMTNLTPYCQKALILKQEP
jgi:poly(3-hydroxybutyrate) depolymerase